MSDRVSLRQVAALIAMQATTAGCQLLFKLGAVGGRWSARRADRRLSAQRVIFRCDHSLGRADRSVSLDPEL
jgi:hypothetical protein